MAPITHVTGKNVKTSKIDSGGALDIDAGTGPVTIDSASGSITVGASLTDGQTLKLGPNGAKSAIKGKDSSTDARG